MKKLSTKQILSRNLERTSPLADRLILWLHNIRSLHNVGAAFRSADAFGIRELWLSGYTPLPPRPEITKTAIGAEEHVQWRTFENEEVAVKELKESGFILAGIEQTDASVMINEFQPPQEKPVCLLMGNEVTGIDKSLIPHLDVALEIPQFGMKHSLNVSVAAGVALYAFFEKYGSSTD